MAHSKKTQLTQIGRSSFDYDGAVNTPITQTSTVLFKDLESFNNAEKGTAVYEEQKRHESTDYGYGIAGTATSFALRDAICELEEGHSCILTPSGLSAVTTALLATVKTGDHILVPDSCYGPARRFCKQNLKALGVETTFYDPEIGEEIQELIKDNTSVLYLESPGSLTFEVQDLDTLVSVAKEKGLTTIIDNSWGTPLFFQPLTIGIDISIIAVTKFIGGHSDIIMGAVIANEGHSNAIQSTFKNLGLNVSAYDCSLALRGLRTCAVRLEHHQQSALKIAEALEKHDRVKEVLCPALPSHKHHALWKKHFSGFASLFSLELDQSYSFEQKAAFIDNLEHFGIGVSWGGYESLIIEFEPHLIRSATREKWQNKGTFIRLYIGLEDADELLEDLLKGLERLS